MSWRAKRNQGSAGIEWVLCVLLLLLPPSPRVASVRVYETVHIRSDRGTEAPTQSHEVFKGILRRPDERSLSLDSTCYEDG